jgi:hypothetical protein
MIKLQKKDIAKLESTQLVYVKLFRLWEPEPRLIFEGITTLHIERYSNGMYFAPHDYDWAQSDLNDVQNNGSVIVEDYLMEIYQL